MRPRSRPGRRRTIAKERKPIDIDDIHSGPKPLQLVEELRETRESRVITHDGEDVAIIRPIKRRRSVPRPRRKTGTSPGMTPCGKSSEWRNRPELPTWPTTGMSILPRPTPIATADRHA